MIKIWTLSFLLTVAGRSKKIQLKLHQQQKRESKLGN